MTPYQFIEDLESVFSQDAFNPYTARCPVHDLEDAPIRRRRTLLTMLAAATESEVDAIRIGWDLGYRRARRTGLALTDDIHNIGACRTMGYRNFTALRRDW